MREMKDRGIEWIGEIPINWQAVNPRWLFAQRKDRAKKGMEQYTASQKYGVISQKDYMNRIGGSIVTVQKDFDILKMVCKGDFVIHMRSFQGGLEYSEHTGSISSAYVMLIPQKNAGECRYFKWLFKSASYINALQSTSNLIRDGQAMRYSNFIQIIIPYPPLVEQQQIADFLDTKCFEIDATAEDIQKEIALLEEYKKSLVYNVISNGINHSIYSTENDEVWGNLPQGWKLVDIKYLFEIVKRIAGKEGYDVLSVTQKGLKIKDITSGDGQLADNYCGYQFVYPTDYVMNHMDLLTGWVDCSELFGVTSPDYRVFRLIDRSAHNLVYYKYVMQCCYMNKIFYSLGQGVSNLGRWRLQTSSFNNFQVPVPPKDEQDEIADYLDTKCSEIDTLIADKKRQLDILADYKKSLIYEYVTGKKEVPVKDF